LRFIKYRVEIPTSYFHLYEAVFYLTISI